MWTALAAVLPDLPCPVTWNAVPFQPCGLKQGSNGSLKTTQVRVGQKLLASIIGLFPRSVPVALGKRASDALEMLGIEYYALRHPSHGGKAEFIDGLARLKMQLEQVHHLDSTPSG